MKKILLLNPPFNGTIIRDYYCPHTSKADYCWPPIDLLVLSGRFKEDEVQLLDCVMDKIDGAEAVKIISEIKPDEIYILTSSISEKNDILFINDLNILIPGMKLFAIGDNVKYGSFKEKCSTAEPMLEFIDETFSYQTPMHELFTQYNYSMPYSRHKKITSILTTYGCPFQCKFCNSNALRYKERSLDLIIEELKEIKKQGIKEIYIRDFTFTANKERVKKLCKLMIENKFNLAWSCDGRVDNVDEETLRLMKKAGCFLIFFGVESADDKILEENNKGFTTKKVREIFKLCKKVGIETLGSFIVGLPQDNKDSTEKTIQFAIDLDCDYASFNQFKPRYGAGYEVTSNDTDSSVETYATMKFYKRPQYILKRILGIRTHYQFVNLIKNGIKILWRKNDRQM
jgi:uncharacterized radical SAM superfamily protein